MLHCNIPGRDVRHDRSAAFPHPFQQQKRRPKAPFKRAADFSSGVHRVEELGVVLGVAQLVEQEVDRVHGAHRI